MRRPSRLKPVSSPAIGSYWKQVSPLPLLRGDKTKGIELVAVTDLSAGYARMGFRQDFVTFTAALPYAMNDRDKQIRTTRKVTRDSFMSSYVLIEDKEDLSIELGMLALAEYV